MTTEQQFTIRVKIEKTDEHPFRGVILENQEHPFKHNTVDNPDFKVFESGTIVELTFRQSADRIKLQGIVKVIDQPVEQTEEHLNEWVLVDTEYFAPEEHRLFETAMQVLDNGDTFRMMAAGPSGYGKTMRARGWAAAHGMKYVRINCAMIRDPEEWYIYREVEATENGGTQTVTLLTPLSKALIEGNTVVVLDEINRLEPWLANSLFSLLDQDGMVEAHGQTITVGPNVLFYMTKNQGHAYVGTFGMDAALARRVDGQINVTAPPPEVERKILVEKKGITDDQAYHIIDMLIKIRKEVSADESVAITTGPALKIATLVAAGQSLREAFQYVVINSAPEELKKGMLDMVNSRLRVL